MIQLVISGGQIGADLAGWMAAKKSGIPTGGFMPLGFLTEDGPRPEFADLYGAREHPSPDYPPRTEANVEIADVTLWFGRGGTSGYWCTFRACRKHRRSMVEVGNKRAGVVGAGIRHYKYRSLNIAGNRASTAPAGFGESVESFLIELFRILED